MEDTMYGHLEVAMDSREKADTLHACGDVRQARVFEGMYREHTDAALGLEKRMREHPA